MFENVAAKWDAVAENFYIWICLGNNCCQLLHWLGSLYLPDEHSYLL